MIRKVFLAIALLVSGVTAWQLPARHYLFSHLNRENSGLAYDGVREIFQDSRGYMWIGTYKGLSRYDGVRFKNYDRDDFGVASDFINVICEDDEGNLWIGTDNGVVIYEYEKDRFVGLDAFLGLMGGGNRITCRQNIRHSEELERADMDFIERHGTLFL